MSTERCERAWQAEAHEDGRLSDAELASFARHTAGCAACRRELAALEQLRELGARLADGARAPLEVRRLRHSLLRRANERIIGASQTPSWRVVKVGVVALCCAALAFVWLAHQPSPQSSRSRSMGVMRTPSYRLEASPDATVRTLEHGDVVRVRLTQGRLNVSVDALGTAQRFVIELFDGELEVMKARIVVIADARGAAAVRVIEGRTVLRLHDEPERTITAGESWSREAEPSPVATDAKQLAPTPATAASSPPMRSRKPVARKPSAARGHGPEPTEFARGVAAFSAGDYGHADSLLLAFIRAHPEDPRVEDAMFLRAVGLSRRGHRKAAADEAREYLRAYPGGLRRPDAERLLEPPHEP